MGKDIPRNKNHSKANGNVRMGHMSDSDRMEL